MSRTETRLALWCAGKLTQSVLAGIAAVQLAAKVAISLPLVPLVTVVALVALAVQGWALQQTWTHRTRKEAA